MFKLIVLLFVLVITLYTDIKENKIKNKHLVVPLALGIFISIFNDGLYGLKDSLLGILLPFVFLFIFFALRMIGAGDIKLFCTIGAIMGFKFIENNIIYTFFVAGVVVIIKLIFTGKLFTTIKGIYYYFKAIFIGKNLIEFPKGEDNSFPFAIAIFIGTILQVLIKYQFI